MKAILLSFAILFIAGGCWAQPSDTAVELRLQLIGKKNSGHMALDMQVINHLAKNIFIPYISSYEIHLYRQSDTGWPSWPCMGITLTHPACIARTRMCAAGMI